jgi:protein-tyrosine phosphatase
MEPLNLNLAPTPNSYWVEPEKLLAGEYPGSTYLARTRQTLNQLVQANVTVFINLTQEREFVEYERTLMLEAAALKRLAAYYHLPILDGDVPPVQEMVETLDTIDTALSAGRTVYVHCLHGRGRTGTVVGCWLVRHGRSGVEALEEIIGLRKALLFGGDKSSPRTKSQQQMVLDWKFGQ